MIGFVLSSKIDKDLSYKISKHPDSFYSRRDGSRMLNGFFTYDGMYHGFISYGTLEEVDDIAQCATWNIAWLNSHTQRTITSMFSTMLRSATKGTELDNEVSTYCLTLCPVAQHFNEKLEQFAFMLGIDVGKSEDEFELHFSSDRYNLSNFLQRCYIFSSFMLRNSHEKQNKAQLTTVSQYIASWNVNTADEIVSFYSGHNPFIASSFADTKLFSLTNRRLLSLHEQKHKLIIEWIKGVDSKDIADIGCGTGQFARMLGKSKVEDYKYIGIDNDARKVQRAMKRNRKSNKFIVADILTDLNYKYVNKNIMLAVEVIEHFTEEERIHFARLVNNYYCPHYIVITTPNVDVNVSLYGMEEGQYRHSDHKIEFDKNGFYNYLSTFSNYVVDNIFDIENSASFAVVLSRSQHAGIDNGFVAKVLSDYHTKIYKHGQLESPFVCADNFYSAKDIHYGFNNKRYNKIVDHCVWLGSSIAPADFAESNDQMLFKGNLEHPNYVFDYYSNRGYTGGFVGEEKVMGSRATVIGFRTEEIANKYGYERLVTVTSRNGFIFFNNDELFDSLYHELFANNKHDVIVLDCEITPWKLKAEGLIERSFRQPITMGLIGKTNYNTALATSVHKDKTLFELDNYFTYLETLEHYTADEHVRIHVFDILLTIDNALGRYKKRSFYYDRKRIDTLKQINTYYSSTALLTPIHYVTGRHDILLLWENINPLEGIVIKPLDIIYNGKRQLPLAMKVRTMEYLMLIYGPDFMKKLDKIMRRNIKLKRRKQALEQGLADYILRSFAYNSNEMRKKFIATAISVDEYNKVDRTL